MKIREIIISDLEDILNWRNDDVSRSMSINNEIISIEDHEKWFKESLENKNRNMFIGLYVY